MKLKRMSGNVLRGCGLGLIAVLVLATAVILQGPKLVNKAVEQGLASVVEDVMPSVVHILYESGEVNYLGQKLGWQGSGVIVDKKGLILTARHVCKKPGVFTVTLHDGRKFTTKAACVSRKYDVGFLKITDANDFPVAKFGDSDWMLLGNRLLAIGSPWGKQHFNSVTLGILSSLNRSHSDDSWGWEVLFQTDVAANPGNSGGPVFNTRGEVVGIVVGSYGPGSHAGITYCVPSNICKKLVDVAQLTFALSQVVPVEANKRLDALEYWQGRAEDWQGAIEDDIYDIEDWLQELEKRIIKEKFEDSRPFNDGMEWFEQ